jgi:threonine synthase
MKNNKFYFECTTCSAKYEQNEVQYLCPKCEKENTPDLPPRGVLKTLYHYGKIKHLAKAQKLFDKLKEKEFRELLPIESERSLSLLKVGKTPLYELSSAAFPFCNSDSVFQVLLKDDSQNPTFSFKDRASEVVCAVAKEKGYKTIVTASTGNAGSSLAGICAAQKMNAVIFIPTSAPKAKFAQISMYGARIVSVDGTYDDAYEMSREASKNFGWYNRNTAYNPFTIEGKKIVSFELFQQMKHEIPDRIFVPVGDGCIISGIYKGYEDLLKLGLIEKIPVIIAVQSKNSDNLVRNLTAEKFISRPSKTIADSISVDLPRNFWMTKKFIEEYQGETIIVSDEEILSASSILSRNSGIFVEPAAAAAFAGLIKYTEQKKIAEKSRYVVLLTGSGLKDIDAVQSIIKIPEPIKSLADLKL